MNELPLNAVIERLSQLEQENRRWKLVGIGAIVILGLVFLLGAAGSKESSVAEEIRARRFILVDRFGTSRAQLAVNQHDVTILEMLIGKYLSGLRKLNPIIVLKVGFEAQLHAAALSIPCGMRALGMACQIGDGGLQRGIQRHHIPSLQGFDHVA